jgi:hypothetical protein
MYIVTSPSAMNVTEEMRYQLKLIDPLAHVPAA